MSVRERNRAMINRLGGKVAIVTGASGGIGRATARALACEGAQVVVADVSESGGQETVNLINANGGSAFFVRTDVSKDDDVKAMVQRAVEQFGGIDLAFNNAGIEGVQAPAADFAEKDWNRVLSINLTGVWLCMKYEIPEMLKRGGGAIVNCSSVAGLVGFPGIAPYVASKHGVVGLTKTAALDYATADIRINAICPGVIETEMIHRFTHEDPRAETQMAEMAPVHRMGRPEEIADAVIWMLSDASSFTTGQAIAVDGGFVTR
jgi:NAD(P)-dependent dehydrogenase (short-subunit alcohol dehydrogenase family)